MKANPKQLNFFAKFTIIFQRKKQNWSFFCNNHHYFPKKKITIGIILQNSPPSLFKE